MPLRFALLSLLLPTLLQAQTPEEAGYLTLTIYGPPSIAATISNFAAYPGPPYTLPDTTGGAPIIGSTSFFYVDPATGELISLNESVYFANVTADVVIALNVAGELAVGCVSETDSTSDIANGAEIDGKIVMIIRGTCPFFVKALNAQAAGALAFIVFNEPDRNPDTISHMGGGSPADADNPVRIPGVLLAFDTAEPIYNAVAGGEAVNASIVCDGDPTYCYTPAAEGSPGADGSRLVVVGLNPAAGAARLAVHTATPQHVMVTAHDVLGREVARLFDGAAHGEQRVTLSDVPPGIYFVRAEGATFRQAQQVTILR